MKDGRILSPGPKPVTLDLGKARHQYLRYDAGRECDLFINPEISNARQTFVSLDIGKEFNMTDFNNP